MLIQPRNGSERLQRFIRYLYEYEQGRKLRNVGFVKAEQGDGECIIHIHGKGFRMKDERKLDLYLFYLEKGECVGIWQGSVENVNPAVNYQLRYTREDTGVPENFERINGILLFDENGNRYAAVWDDTPVNLGRIRFWKPVVPVPEDQVPLPDAGMPEEITDLDDLPGKQEEIPDELSGEQEEISEEPAEEQQEKIPDDLPENQSSGEIMEEEIPKIQESRRCVCRKLQRKDLALLPSCEWKLANNSFLLHGYYNYHHIVLLDRGEGLKLGVPGIYHPQEARAAGAFGFPEFIDAGQVEIDRTEEEENSGEKFGYWCRNVRGQMPPA